MTIRQIYNRETAHPERHIIRNHQALIVRAAMAYDATHAVEHALALFR
jgi:hypothetical protein